MTLYCGYSFVVRHSFTLYPFPEVVVMCIDGEFCSYFIRKGPSRYAFSVLEWSGRLAPCRPLSGIAVGNDLRGGEGALQ